MAGSIKVATVEYAGKKFKTHAQTGLKFPQEAESLITKLKKEAPNIRRVITSEEKYLFTPDIFKFATHQKRAKKPATKSQPATISHLKTVEEMISEVSLDKKALLETKIGKAEAGQWLARYIDKLNIHTQLVIDVDSELHTQGTCSCSNPLIISSWTQCDCDLLAIPVRACFGADGFISQELLHSKPQRKGETEIAQADWLIDVAHDIAPG